VLAIANTIIAEACAIQASIQQPDANSSLRRQDANVTGSEAADNNSTVLGQGLIIHEQSAESSATHLLCNRSGGRLL
jgi:hypothetical protein